MRSRRRRLRLHGWNRNPGAGNRVSSAAFAAEVSRVDGAVQGVFGADWIGEESGAVSGGVEVGVSESGADGVVGGSYVSDVAGCYAGGVARNFGAEPDSA